MIKFNHVVAYVPARNEEKYVGKTLDALLKLEVDELDIVVVDDGSSDDTRKVAVKRGVSYIRIRDNGYNKLGQPSLASTHNLALHTAMELRPQSVLIVGADHILPVDYITQLEQRMQANTAIASGIARGEYLVPENPSGSGRLVTSWFLDEVGWRYPVMWGWEAYWIYKAWSLGYETRCYHDVLMETQRPNKAQNRDLSDDVARYYGYAMRQLGYYWPNAVNRARIFGAKSFSAGIHMLAGYFTDVGTSDVAHYVRDMQYRRLLNGTKRRATKGLNLT